MPLEATTTLNTCENGEYYPTRFEAQADAVTNVVFKTKIDLNAESTVGIMTMAGKGYVSFCLSIVISFV